MAEVLLLSFDLALGILVTWRILRFDYARLSGERLNRAWPDASFWLAIVMFGPLCLPFHFTRTRRSVLGFLQGIAWMIGAFVAIGLILEALGFLMGVGG